MRQHFTGYERDAETGLDYAQARYYSNQAGRFTSPDPLLGSAKLQLPQSWNRYAYCINMPLVYTDRTGLDWAGKTLEGGMLQPTFFDNEIKDENGQTAYTRALADGYTALPPNRENGDYIYQSWQGDTRGSYALHADGTHGWSNPERETSVNMMPEQAFEIAGIISGANRIFPIFSFLNSPNIANQGATLPERELENFVGQPQPVTIGEGEVLYGVRGPDSRSVWWSRVKPQGELQWRMDQAVRPEWNSGTHLETLIIPRGQALTGFEGPAQVQPPYLGGGNQIYVPNVPSGWTTIKPWP
jgi:RHS repeat-associated protein